MRRVQGLLIRQQVGHDDVCRSQRLAISRERAAERRILETGEHRHHIHAYNIEFSSYLCQSLTESAIPSREAFLRILRMH